MDGSLGWSPVRSSVGGEAELAALLGPVFGEGQGQLGQTDLHPQSRFDAPKSRERFFNLDVPQPWMKKVED